MLERRFRSLGQTRDLADSAIDTAGGDPDERLLEMRDTYALMEEGFASLLRERLRRKADGPDTETTSLAADA